MSAALGLGATSQQAQILAFVASAVLGSLLIIALIKGRRIKFVLPRAKNAEQFLR